MNCQMSLRTKFITLLALHSLQRMAYWLKVAFFPIVVAARQWRFPAYCFQQRSSTLLTLAEKVAEKHLTMYFPMNGSIQN